MLSKVLESWNIAKKEDVRTHPLYLSGGGIVHAQCHRRNQNISQLELCRLWCSWERNDVADVLHTCHEEYKALKTEAETTVRT